MTTHRCRRAAFSELPSTHQEALEAAITAGQSQGIRDERSTAERIEAAIAAYLTTLAPAADGLVAELRKAAGLHPPLLASPLLDQAADTITAQAAEIERLKAEVARHKAPPSVLRNCDLHGEGRETPMFHFNGADDNGLYGASVNLDGYAIMPKEKWFAAEARLSALEALLDKAVWRPIETAPNDGTDIILGSSVQEYQGQPVAPRVTIGHWATDEECRVDLGDCGGDCHCREYEYVDPTWISWDGGFTAENPPTHWMPLPAAPAAIQEARHGN